MLAVQRAMKDLSVNQEKLARQLHANATGHSLAAQKELLASQYNQAAAYTQVIIGAGYVSFFVVWETLHDILPRTALLASALWLCISVLLFVTFEVGKLVLLTLFLRHLDQLLNDRIDLLTPARSLQEAYT